MYTTRCTLLTLLCLLHIAKGAKTTGLAIDFKHIECQRNEHFLTELNCLIGEPQMRQVFGSFTINQDISVVTSAFTVFKINANNGRTKLFNRSFDVCKMLTGQRSLKIIDIIHNIMTAHTDIPRQCPFKKGSYKFYNISGIENLPPVIADFDFQVFFHYFVPKAATLMNITIDGRLVNTKKKGTQKSKA